MIGIEFVFFEAQSGLESKKPERCSTREKCERMNY